MEPLEPELRRIVHDGMVEAVPGAEVQRRVLEGLRVRLLDPPGGPQDPEAPEGSSPEPPASGGPAASTASAGMGKIVLLAAALGGVAAIVVAARGGPEHPRADAAPKEAPSVLQPRSSNAPVGPASPLPRPAPAAASRPRSPGTPGSAAAVAPRTSGAPGSAAAAAPRTSGAPGSASGRRAGSPELASDIRPRGRQAPPSPDAAPTPAPETLVVETRLLAQAERALAGGDVRRAMELTRTHAAEHPDGQLRVERIAIELRARCMTTEPAISAEITMFLAKHGHTPAAAKVRAQCRFDEISDSGDG